MTIYIVLMLLALAGYAFSANASEKNRKCYLCLVFSAIVISIAIFIIYRVVMYIVYTFEIIFLTNKIKTKVSAQIVDMYIKKGDSTLVDAGDGILVPVESPNKYCITLRYENYQYTIDNINIYKKFNVGDYIDTYLIKHIYKKSKKLHSYEIKEA